MNHHRVGTCSLCGGDVLGHRGTWSRVTLPPPDRCLQCGAQRQTDILDMLASTRVATEEEQDATTLICPYCHVASRVARAFATDGSRRTTASGPDSSEEETFHRCGSCGGRFRSSDG